MSDFSSRSNILMALVMYLAVPLSGLGVDIYAPSLPSMVSAFSTKRELVQLTMTFYLLGFGIGQPIFGAVTDHYGRRWVMLAGSILTIVLIFLMLHTRSIWEMIFLRFMQGVSISIICVPARAIVADLFTGKLFKKYIGNMTVAWAMGPILGPWIGGHLQHNFGWKANFIFLMGYTFVLLFLLIFVFRETMQVKQSKSLWHSYARSTAIFKSQYFMIGILFMGVLMSFFIVFNLIAPFIVQHELKYSAVVYGRIALLNGVAFFLGNMSNRVMPFLSYSAKFPLALLVMLCGAVSLCVLGYMHILNLWALLVPSLVMISMAGFLVPNQVSLCLSLFPNMAGMANACLFAGAWVVCGATTYIGTHLHVKNLLPLASLDLSLVVVGSILYFIFLRRSSEVVV